MFITLSMHSDIINIQKLISNSDTHRFLQANTSGLPDKVLVLELLSRDLRADTNLCRQIRFFPFLSWYNLVNAGGVCC